MTGRPERAELEDLRGQLQARVQVGMAPAQPDVAGRCDPHRLRSGVPAVPGHAVALERVAHPLLVAGRRCRGSCRRPCAARRRCRWPLAAWAARSSPACSSAARTCPCRQAAAERPSSAAASGAGYIGQDRRQQHALAAGRGDAAFEEAAQLLGLAQQVAGGGGDHRRSRRRDRRVRSGTDCGTSVRYAHSRPVNASLLRGGGGHRAATQHHQVVPLVGVDPGQQVRRLPGAGPARSRAGPPPAGCGR